MTVIRGDAMPPIHDLLPHRDAMLLVDRALAGDASFIEVECVVPSRGWHIDSGEDAIAPGMPAWIGIELMAQAIAAHAGLLGSLAGQAPKRGLLLGSRDYSAAQGSFKAGDVLRIAAHISFRDDSGFGAYDCSITGPAGETAKATLKVFEPPDFDAFIRRPAAT